MMYPHFENQACNSLNSLLQLAGHLIESQIWKDQKLDPKLRSHPFLQVLSLFYELQYEELLQFHHS